jgi:ABC-type multidrug transport system fused ATPase/permease subunit
MKLRKAKTLDQDDEDIDSYSAGTLTILKRLLAYIGAQSKRLLAPLVFFMVCTVLINWSTPLIFRSLIDNGLGGGIGATTGDIDIVIRLGSIFIFLTILGVFTRIAQGYIISKLATITMYNLRHELFVKFQNLGLNYHENPARTTGKKINYLTGDVNTIQELIQSGLLVSVSNIFLIMGSLIFMIILSPGLTLITFLIVPFFFLIAGLLFKKARIYFKQLRERVANVTGILDESILGMRIIQSFAIEPQNYKEFNDATLLERRSTMKAAKLQAFIPAIMMIVITFGFGLILISSGFLIRSGDLTQGTLIAFIFYIFTFFEPLFSLIGFFTLLQNSVAAGARILRLLDENIAVKEKENPIEIHALKGIIEYEGVNFSYENNIPVLKNINLLVHEKERLALVGYTGAGKSTFIKLLSRFYDPTDGIILIDGIDLRELDIRSIRKKIGIVLQDNFLFSGTIIDNIRYGKLGASDEEVIEAAKKVNAHEFIMELENGYNTIVGERGNRLSEGQRQLVAFARALISNPPILILDEATSSIDPYSELLIQRALETLLKGRTSITIAHRLSTIIHSDRIIVLDKGEIIEVGSHKELLKLNEFYSHLYKMQFKDPFKKEKPEEDEERILVEPNRDSFEDAGRFSGFL